MTTTLALALILTGLWLVKVGVVGKPNWFEGDVLLWLHVVLSLIAGIALLF